MTIHEIDLPGVGKKYTIDMRSKDKVVVVLHRTGKREVYHFLPEKADTPNDVLELTTEEARQIGGILSQTYFVSTPDTSQDLIMKELTIEWINIKSGHPLTNLSVRDAAVREKSGATIIAILRDGDAFINPAPEEIINLNDTLMIIGNAGQIHAFLECFDLKT